MIFIFMMFIFMVVIFMCRCKRQSKVLEYQSTSDTLHSAFTRESVYHLQTTALHAATRYENQSTMCVSVYKCDMIIRLLYDNQLSVKYCDMSISLHLKFVPLGMLLFPRRLQRENTDPQLGFLRNYRTHNVTFVSAILKHYFLVENEERRVFIIC